MNSCEELWLAIDEVIHHDDIMTRVVIRPRSNVSGLDLDRSDACVIELHGEEGQVSIARGSRNETGEQQSAISVEVLDERARPAVVDTRAWPAIWLINICEHRAEASDCCRNTSVGTGYREGSCSDVASHRSEQPGGAERPERGGVRGIAKEYRQPALGPTRRRSLRKP